VLPERIQMPNDPADQMPIRQHDSSGDLVLLLLGGVLGSLFSFTWLHSKGPSWTLSDIDKQFDFANAAKSYNFDPAVLLGIASRETNMKNIIGAREPRHSFRALATISSECPVP
jgi:hypothetical protein